MVRTQIYQTEAERKASRTLAARTGRSQSELIREAVDRMISREQGADRTALLSRARGMWKNRDDLPDLATLRREFERNAAGRTRWQERS